VHQLLLSVSAGRGLNPRPSVYRTAALPIGATGRWATLESNQAVNRVSDGPRQPAGSLPAERKIEVSSLATTRAATGVQSPLPRRRRTFHRGTKRCRPPPLKRPAAFGAAPTTRRVLVPCSAPWPGVNRHGDGRGRRIRISPRRAARFPARASRLAGSSSKSKSRRRSNRN
jgi:hypothetical protein